MANNANPSRWKKGTSGNPAGKPPGSGRLQAMRDKLADDVPDILASLSTLAKGGDAQAARLILERVLPPLKPMARLLALEAPSNREGKPLPLVVADDTSDGDLERLCRGGTKVYRWSDFLEALLLER